ncbi:glycosyltransferase involved in cell wall biosynthesis [Neobacillus niacini]|uniref:glycosyltransferase family 4 protein n=1 Tax=Neobacillus niacini TaxID=86668 RepID=UPI002860544F|nr:glycosyltransferase family 4 protein [Neobacillus niacini]MDR7079576.1 glycosyltransferase involved in cell wall biosynthesis [Neobacillus niacini]
MRNKKIIVAHPGRQHSFRLAKALKEEGILFKYITTVYDKESSILMRITKRLIGKDNLKRANSRKSAELDDTDVEQFCEFYGLVELLLMRVDKTGILYKYWARYVSHSFGKKVARYAMKNKVDAVILYDTNASCCFEILKEKAPNIIRIMDVSAANRLYMKAVYEEDMKRNTQFAKKLYNERNFLWENDLSELVNEIEFTQYFLAPSIFVRDSLSYSGVSEDKVKICPYGSNFSVPNLISRNRSQELKVLFVGNVTQMKGIGYLLEAFKVYNKAQVSLTLVGHYDNEDGIFNEYKKKYNFLGRVTHEQVERICNESDIFVFPSLGEGMSLAALEAMSCGLPLICSTNSGVNDLIVEGENGFVVPIGNSEAIKEKVDWFLNNREQIEKMSDNARVTALKYTWENYEYNVVKALNSIIETD